MELKASMLHVIAKHIEAETKWLPFRRQQFQMNFI